MANPFLCSRIPKGIFHQNNFHSSYTFRGQLSLSYKPCFSFLSAFRRVSSSARSKIEIDSEQDRRFGRLSFVPFKKTSFSFISRQRLYQFFFSFLCFCIKSFNVFFKRQSCQIHCIIIHHLRFPFRD